MYLVLILRDGNIHIVNYQTSNGGYKTICSQNFSKKMRMNTLMVDNTFPGICDLCKKDCDDMYQYDLDHNPTIAYKRKTFAHEDIVGYHRFDLIGPKVKYENIMDKNWSRLNKYKRLLNRNKKK